MGILDGILRRPKKMTAEEYMKKMLEKGIDEYGNFVVSDVPMAPPIGYKKQPSMVEMVREMVRSERLRAEAEAADAESFEESEDFDVDDDPDYPHTPWTNDFDPPLREILREGQAEIDRKAKIEADKMSQPPKDDKRAKEGPSKEGVQGD